MDDITYLDLKSEFYAEILILFNHELLFNIHGIYPFNLQLTLVL